MKRIFVIIWTLAALITCSSPASAQKKHETQKMGGILVQKDSSAHAGRLMDNRLFIPKGSVGVGLQFSYFDLSSTDSEWMLLVQGMDAKLSHFSAAPTLSYCIADNKVIGARFRFVNTEGSIGDAELSLLGAGDLSFSVNDISAQSGSMMSEIYYSSYMGIDDQGRFGLFANVALQYANTRTTFAAGKEPIDAYTLSRRIKMAVRPGFEIFVMNNISTMFSVGIGGVSFTNTRCMSGGEVTGVLNASQARFKLDITDIAMGMTVHF